MSKVRSACCRALALSLGMLATAAATPAMAAPVTTDTALPVAEGNFLWRSQLVLRERSDDGPMDREVSVRALGNALGYGLTSRLAVFASVPYFLDRELTVTTPDGRITRSTSGLGDLSLFARYTVFREDQPGRTFRVAPVLGLKAPTGDDSDRDAFGRLPRPLQAGTGTWDGFAGVVTTYQTLDYQLDAQLRYRHHGRHEGFSPGNEARLDASLQYRILPREIAGSSGFVYALLESNLIHSRPDTLQGQRDDDSGGTQWLLAPGLQYVGPRWIWEGAVQVPVSQNPRGDAIQDDYIARIGLRHVF